jgi:oxygen-dependent protoporphyrinogen oxidase
VEAEESVESRLSHVVIIGGGIAGLAAAHRLQKEVAGRPVRYTLLEGSARLGGKIASRSLGGYLVEGGPDCFLTRKPGALNLARELGLEGDLIGTNEQRRKVYVLHRGRLYPLPEGVMLIVPTEFMPFAVSPLLSIPGKLRMGMDLLIRPRREDGDETLASFVRRRLGKEALDKIAEPLLSGIHVSDPERLSLKSSFPRLLETEQTHGSLIRGMVAAKRAMAAARHKNGSRPSMPMFMTLRGGLQQLVDAVAAELDPAAVRTGCPVVAVERAERSGGGYRVQTAAGEALAADGVVLATPSDVSARLVKGLDPDLAAALGTIRYVSTAVVSLGFRPGDDMPALNGFGFIIPKTEGRRITACTWTSTKFDHRAPAGHQLVRTFVGGPGREALAEQDDEVLIEAVREELAEIMGLRGEPEIAWVSRWTKANPQYDLNHLDRVAEMRRRAEAHGGLALAGCAYDGVGVPDCIRQGQEAAGQILSTLVISEGVV